MNAEGLIGMRAWSNATCLATLTTAVLIGFLSVLPQSVKADDGVASSDDARDESALGLIPRVGSFVEETQRSASERFTGFAETVDGFFGEGVDDTKSNTSWARIRFEADKPGDEDLKLAATVKLRIVLPQSEQRFRLLFSSEDEDEGSVVSAEGASQSPKIDQGGDESGSLALRFIRTARDTSSVNYDVGARSRDGRYQVFGRINARIEGEMIRYWTGRVSNNYYYYAKSGFANKLSFSVKRPFKNRFNLLYQTSLGFDWRKRRKGAGIGLKTGLYADVNEKTAVALEALAGYSTALNGDDSARYRGSQVRIRLRQNIWRPWLFYEIWPSVVWPSSNDYERVYGMLFRIETIIGQPN